MIEEEIIINKEDTPPEPEPDSELLPAIIRSGTQFPPVSVLRAVVAWVEK